VINSQSKHDKKQSILVIQTKSLKSFVHALRAFSAIRMHHDGAGITLVCSKAMLDFARVAPYFDEVIPDPGSVLGLCSLVRGQTFNRVYDLDASRRTKQVFNLAKTWRQRLGLEQPIPWCGHAKGCSYFYTNSDRAAAHCSDSLMTQIGVAGISEHPPASLAWVSRSVGTFALPLSLSEPFILFAIDPGGVNGVQWTPDHYAEMAAVSSARGERPVLIGEKKAQHITEAVVEVVPETINLCGQASYIELVFLAWAASCAIGADNSFMHLLAAAGCRSVVLYDPGSDAALSGHRGPDVTILRRHTLASIAVAEVVQALNSKTIA